MTGNEFVRQACLLAFQASLQTNTSYKAYAVIERANEFAEVLWSRGLLTSPPVILPADLGGEPKKRAKRKQRK